jgi:hypothetical protein
VDGEGKMEAAGASETSIKVYYNTSQDIAILILK